MEFGRKGTEKGKPNVSNSNKTSYIQRWAIISQNYMTIQNLEAKAVKGHHCEGRAAPNFLEISFPVPQAMYFSSSLSQTVLSGSAAFSRISIRSECKV